MGSTLLIICNLFLLEVMLSIDNAAVLAIMVKDLPSKDQPHALRYGVLGAFIFRGASLFAVSWLIKISWLKVIGGLYLIYLVYGHFTDKNDSIEEEGSLKDSRIFRFGGRIGLSRLWATVLLVEIMDMAFSVDNIFASIAITDRYSIILIGVFLGIIAMRFAAYGFTVLMSKFSSLEHSAFVVIGLLGVKLMGVGLVSAFPYVDFMNGFMLSKNFDLIFSCALMLIFFLPLITRKIYKHAVH